MIDNIGLSLDLTSHHQINNIIKSNGFYLIAIQKNEPRMLFSSSFASSTPLPIFPCQ
jgi:hypothetical protein